MRKPRKQPGCATLLATNGYCERHAANAPKRGADYQQWRRKDANQSAVDGIRSSSRWQRVRRAKLSSDPLCEDPHGEHERRANTASAKQVHHIKGLATHPELAFHADNLMSVCAACHARLEGEARRSARSG